MRIDRRSRVTFTEDVTFSACSLNVSFDNALSGRLSYIRFKHKIKQVAQTFMIQWPPVGVIGFT